MADDNVDANNNTDADDTILKPEDQEPDKKEPDKKEPDTQEPDKKEPDKQEPDKKEPDKQEPDKKEPDKKEPEGAPEKYEDFTLPEGVEVSEELMGEFTTLAKEMNLPQESAQKLIEMVPKYEEALRAKDAEAWKTTRETWVKDIKEDSEFGGEKFDETVERANRIVKKYGSDELSTFLVDSGFGDNADLVKLLAKVDIALGEDVVVDGGPSGDKATDAASVMYPDQGKG